MRKILIIEDEPEILTILAMALENDGEFQALTARGGREGLHVAQSERPDVILADVLMPGMDGYEVCRRVKADPELRHIPIVLLSAQAEHKAQEMTREAGACACLGKPFDPMGLSGRIKAIIDEATPA